MKSHKIFFAFLLLAIGNAFGNATALRSYEYWIDDNYDTRETVLSEQEDIFATVSLANLSSGVHFFNIRFANSDFEVSSPSRYLFYIPDVSVTGHTLTGYEYWLDDDFNSRTHVSGSDMDQTFMIDLKEVASGIHFLNYRAFSDNSIVGCPTRYLFYIPDVSVTGHILTGYEYWLDDDFNSRTHVSGSDLDQTFMIDLKDVAPGIHFLNYRAFSDNSIVGCPSRYLFYIPDKDIVCKNLTGYEYWLDNDFESRTFVAGSGEDQTMLVDLKDIPSGVHFFNYRAFADNDVIASPTRYLFYIPDNVASTNCGIVGYEYSFNDKTTFVPIAECEEFEMNATPILLPDVKEVAQVNSDCTFSFADDKATMSNNAQVCFLLRFRNSGGESSMPISYEYNEEYLISKECMNLQLQKTVLFDKVPSGDMQPVKFEIPKSAVYYIRATQACDMFIFDANGKPKTTVTVSSLLKTYSVSLTAGTYYGIVHNTLSDADNTDKQVGLRLMATNNAVPTPEISYENETVTITCLQDDAVIYYTLDGTVPDENSHRYTVPFKLGHNADIRAVAKAPDYADSYIASLKVDSYKVAAPSIQFANLKIYITCETSGSRIYYTIDGSDPARNGQLYNDAVPMVTNCTVRAVAKKDYYNDSDEAQYVLDISNVKCSVPILTVSGNLLTMSTLTAGASIYYTTDGSVPTNKCKIYRSPILLERNDRYRAVAVKSGEIDSDVAEITIDWFNAEIPEFSFAGGKLTMTSKTRGGTIYYEIGGADPTRNSAKYTSPVALTDNRIVKAFTVADGFNDSEIVSYSPSSFTCVMPQIQYDGRAMTLATSTPNAAIYYTIDGSNPGIGSERYDSKVILPGLCSVKAVAIAPDMNNSPVMTYVLPAYYNGGDAYVQSAGSLSKAFEWCGTMPEVESLKINGTLADSDFACIRKFTALRHLDLSAVSVMYVPDNAFEKMNLLTVTMPEVNFSAGAKLMSGCGNLAAIVWNSNTQIPLDILDGMTLPNMLLYVKYAAVANAKFSNIVVDNLADNITLSDSDNSNFYAPISFTAHKISYTHHYTQTSGYDRCSGWESIALPFAPTSITHETRGEIAPFAAGDTGKKQFWLCELTSTGFVSAPSIEANTPYIIAMPNSDNYSDEYILSGKVTFEGINVAVKGSDELVTASKGDNLFVPNFQVTPKNSCMALNVGEVYNGHPEGSLFAFGLRNARPFESYVTNSSMLHMPSPIFKIGFGASDVMMQLDNVSVTVESEGGRLKVSGLLKGDIIDIVALDGVRVLNLVAEDNVTYADKPLTGPVVITVSRSGRIIRTLRYIL